MSKYKIFKIILVAIAAILLLLYVSKKPSLNENWQEHLRVLSTAEFTGDTVTIKNVRDFRYGPTEKDLHPNYYDKSYNLNEIVKVWYITEPFNENDLAAHTFVSFEFKNGDFVSISIEARKKEGQDYSITKGMFKAYPLIYIAADERDVVLLRANLRKDLVYVYPVRLQKTENARLLFVDMLSKMNSLTKEPKWYHSMFSNCTSAIAKHVNNITPGRISKFSWQLWLTGSADKLALKSGILDTDLTIEQAREKFLITKISQKVGDVEEYSKLIRSGFDNK